MVEIYVYDNRVIFSLLFLNSGQNDHGCVHVNPIIFFITLFLVSGQNDHGYVHDNRVIFFFNCD